MPPQRCRKRLDMRRAHDLVMIAGERVDLQLPGNGLPWASPRTAEIGLVRIAGLEVEQPTMVWLGDVGKEGARVGFKYLQQPPELIALGDGQTQVGGRGIGHEGLKL